VGLDVEGVEPSLGLGLGLGSLRGIKTVEKVGLVVGIDVVGDAVGVVVGVCVFGLEDVGVIVGLRVGAVEGA